MNENPQPQLDPRIQEESPVSIPPPVGHRDLAIHSAIGRPMKKKIPIGRILGWVLGSVGVLAVVGGLLFYFLYWQNPSVIIADAAAKLIATEQLKMSGIVTVKSSDYDVKFEIVSNRYGRSASTTMSIDLKQGDSLEPVKLQLDGVLAESGTLYLKVDGLEKAVSGAVDAYATYMLSAFGDDQQLSQEQQVAYDQMVEQMRLGLEKVVSQLVEKVDDQWLKLSTEESEQQNEELSCVLGVVETLGTDEKMRQEVVGAYRNNNFVIVKGEAGTRDTSTGYELQLDGAEVSEKIDGFEKEFKQTKFAVMLEGCSGEDDDEADEFGGPGETNTEEAAVQERKLVLWVDRAARQLTGFDLSITSEGSVMVANMDIESNTSESITVPPDARNLQEVVNEIMRTMMGPMVNSMAPNPEADGSQVVQI